MHPVRLRLEDFVLAHLEELGSVRLVHRQEGHGEPAGSGEELAPAHPQPARRQVRELEYPALDLFLLGGLRIRQVLPVGDHLGGNGRSQLVPSLISGLELIELLLAEPRLLLARPRHPVRHVLPPWPPRGSAERSARPPGRGPGASGTPAATGAQSPSSLRPGAARCSTIVYVARGWRGAATIRSAPATAQWPGRPRRRCSVQ